MENFCRKIIAFILIPIVGIFFIENLLPPTFFVFRGWEAFRAIDSNLPGPFYPNQKCQMIETGDLAPHTKYAVKKPVMWKTDKLGYRNNFYIPNPDILIVGDSMVTGSSISQENTISNILSNKTNQKVYNISPANMTNLIQLKNSNLINPKNIIILALAERGLNEHTFIESNSNIESLKLYTNPLYIKPIIWIDRLSSARCLRFLKSQINQGPKIYVQSKSNKRMLFYKELGNIKNRLKSILNKHEFNSKYHKSNDRSLAYERSIYENYLTNLIKQESKELDRLLKVITQYKNYSNSIGCKFIFLPIPNKPTILWKMAGMNEQPTFLHKLGKKLTKHGIICIDAIALFESLLNKNIIPYHYDDTHWNEHAINLVAEKISTLVKNIDKIKF